MRVPCSNNLTGCYFTVFFGTNRTVRNLVQLTLTAMLIRNTQLTRTGYRYQVSAGLMHNLDIV